MAESVFMSRRHDPEAIKRVLRFRERRGLTWTALSDESGVPLSTLHYYDHRFRKEAESGGFVSVAVRDDPPPLGSDLEVVLRNGMSIRVPIGFDDDHLSRLVRALDSGC